MEKPHMPINWSRSLKRSSPVPTFKSRDDEWKKEKEQQCIVDKQSKKCKKWELQREKEEHKKWKHKKEFKKCYI
jgi:hypothetical protein